MPFPRPTLSQLTSQVAADIATAIPGADALLRFSILGVIGRVLAALINGLFGYLDWIALQAVPWTATDIFLEAWAALKGVYRNPPVAAAGTATFSGASTSDLPSGTPVVRSDNTAYVTTADGTVSGALGGQGTVTVPIAAVVPGSAGTIVPGSVMTLGTSVPGVQSGGVAATSTTTGVDLETDVSLRARMLAVYAAPAQGGDQADYVNWSLAVPGVTRAWCVPLEDGAGTVSVYFMMDAAESAFGGFPQGTNGVATLETRATAATGDQLTLANALYPLRPVTALVTAKAPAKNTVNFTINGISGASAATKTAISAAIDAVFLAYGSPGTVSGAGGVVDLSYIESAIAAIPATAGFVITTVSCNHGTIAPGTDGNITSTAGYLPVRGTTTYT